MIIIFRFGNERFRYEIDRKTRTLKVQSRKTNYQLTPLPWHMLFDKGRENEQDDITSKLDDKEFMLAIASAMAQHGYLVVRAEL